MNIEFVTKSEKETRCAGNKLGARLRGGEVITLSGPLGAGKTSFVKGIGEALNISPDLISSPTFILRAEYEGNLPVAHIDLYRLDIPEEVESLGLFEQENPLTILLIEWPEKAMYFLPPERLQIEMTLEGECKRHIFFTEKGIKFGYLLQELIQ